jgi:ABC-type polysaccharide/polyol phosphate transport system ATPase subunit
VNSAEPVIRLVDAGKRYTKYEDQPMLLTSILHLHPRTRRSALWALRGCNITVGPGECVGVLGLNGSGKSTLLQMLAGVTAPSEGSVLVRGRVAPLVQVGVGFHPELTGRENVYVNGTILGLTHAEINERFDEILDFAELAEFIDTPVKFYSSGMYVRLGFSVAIHAEPDVLLVDEVLAVGDLPFQMKCFERMQSIRATGTTMVVVSHNIHAVRRLCDRALVLNRGRVRFEGPIADAVNNYYELIGKREDVTAEEGVVDVATGPVDLPPLDLVDSAGEPTRQLTADDEATFVLEVQFLADVAEPWPAFILNSASGERIYSEYSAGLLGACHEGERIRCEISMPVRLPTGTYWAEAGLWDGAAGVPLGMSRPVCFHVSGRDAVKGLVDLGAQMSVRRLDAEPAAAPIGRA